MKNKNIYLIGVASDSGASVLGCASGPDAICKAGLIPAIESLGYTVNDCGDIFLSENKKSSPYTVVSILERASKELFNEELFDNNSEQAQTNSKLRLKNLDEVNEINTELFKKVSESLNADGFPLVLGGDHSIAAASVLAVKKHYGKIGLIWVDAHGDFNDAFSSPSGNIHGMPLSAIAGNGPNEILPFLSGLDKSVDTAENAETLRNFADQKNNCVDKSAGMHFVDPKNIVLIAARDLDSTEKLRLKNAGITVFTMSDIDRDGISFCINEALKIACQATAGVYLSFDLDALDPLAAPGVGTPVIGGLTFRESRVLCETLYKSDRLLGFEVVELNPACENESNKDSTAAVAVELIKTLLGHTQD